MYDKQPMRWRDVPRTRDDVFVPLLEPWEGRAARSADVREAYARLPAKWDGTAENELFDMLFDCFSTKLYLAASLPPIKATIAEALATVGAKTTMLGNYNPDHYHYSVDDILDVSEKQAELEALRRWAMVLHNQQPWDRSQARLKPLAEMQDDDIVVLYYPKDRHVLDFINREKSDTTVAKQAPTPDLAVEPVRPYPPLVIGDDAPIQPKIEALAIRKGEVICSNEDVVRNSPPRGRR